MAMFQFATLLFSILALICFTLATSDPRVSFTVRPRPSTIEIGSPTLARCSITGLDMAEYSSFSVDFHLTSSYDTNTALRFASWTTNNPNAQGNFTADSSLLRRLDLAASAGPSGIYPNYEVKLNPMNASASGAYWCVLLVHSHKFGAAFMSDQINTSPASQ